MGPRGRSCQCPRDECGFYLRARDETTCFVFALCSLSSIDSTLYMTYHFIAVLCIIHKVSFWHFPCEHFKITAHIRLKRVSLLNPLIQRTAMRSYITLLRNSNNSRATDGFSKFSSLASLASILLSNLAKATNSSKIFTITKRKVADFFRDCTYTTVLYLSHVSHKIQFWDIAPESFSTCGM